MSIALPHQPRRLTIVLLRAEQVCSRTTVTFTPDRLWFAVGTTSECDLIVTEPDFPQLAFQINWHPTREPLLYVHPAMLWLDGQQQRASLHESIFPLGGTAAIRLQGTTTVFIVSRSDGATSDALSEAPSWRHIARLLSPPDRTTPALPPELSGKSSL